MTDLIPDQIPVQTKKIIKRKVKEEDTHSNGDSQPKYVDLHKNPNIKFEEDSVEESDGFSQFYALKPGAAEQSATESNVEKVSREQEEEEEQPQRKKKKKTLDVKQESEEKPNEGEKKKTKEKKKNKAERKKKSSGEKKEKLSKSMKSSSGEKKKRSHKNKTFKSIIALQKSGKFCIPKANFSRLVREIMAKRIADNEHFKTGIKIKKGAMRFLHMATEDFMTSHFAKCILLLRFKRKKELKPDAMAVSLRFSPVSDMFEEVIKDIEKEAEADAIKQREIRQKSRKQIAPKRIIKKKQE